jgi:N-acylneuraminate cytidylyltransferase
MLKPLYIIPARGGSKGIPHKNIKLLGGKPLIAYSIDVAKALADDVRRIVLSTDDEEIADVARKCGLPVDYMRPAEFATDTSGSREVMIDVMDWADAQGIDYDCIVLLQPTSPLRTVEDVTSALALYNDSLDMVVSVAEARTLTITALRQMQRRVTCMYPKAKDSILAVRMRQRLGSTQALCM